MECGRKIGADGKRVGANYDDLRVDRVGICPAIGEGGILVGFGEGCVGEEGALEGVLR